MRPRLLVPSQCAIPLRDAVLRTYTYQQTQEGLVLQPSAFPSRGEAYRPEVADGRGVHLRRTAHRGYRGDTISSALAADGVQVLGRSFKYHRPRGLLSAAGHNVNAMMQVRNSDRSVPNVRADIVAIQQGWEVTAVDTRGGLARDSLSLLNRLAPFLPVGFYYKAFHSKRWFPRWERMFRRLTGLGTVDFRADARTTPKRYDFCDVLIVGAGPSGLAAALGAAEQGASVLLVDESPGTWRQRALCARWCQFETAERTGALVRAVRDNARIRLFDEHVRCGLLRGSLGGSGST